MKCIPKSYLYLAFSLILAACGGKETTNEAQVDSPVSEESMEAVFQKIELGLGQKPAWKSHWTAAAGEINSADFEWVFTDSIDPMEMPEKNPILENDPLFPYQFPHPEGNGAIDLYSYKVEIPADAQYVYLNPDAEVIWYRSDGMKERLLFMGPSGLFEEGLWLSPSEFLVMGYFQEDEGFRPMLWLIKTDTHQVSQFRLKKVIEDYMPDSYLKRRLQSIDLSSNGN
jgi:hypothetical protein